MIEEVEIPTESTTTRTITLRRAVAAGIYQPCGFCGTNSADGYSSLLLVMALQGAVKIDPNPTHLCVS